MTKRKAISKLKRSRIFLNAGGVCCICGLMIFASRGDKWIVEHPKPLWLGGADDETNMGPAHENCGREKTSAEAPVKAKSDRVRANFLGIKQSRNPMPGSRRSKWKRKMDGSVVLR